jgi:hypothetical protein
MRDWRPKTAEDTDNQGAGQAVRDRNRGNPAVDQAIDRRHEGQEPD